MKMTCHVRPSHHHVLKEKTNKRMAVNGSSLCSVAAAARTNWNVLPTVVVGDGVVHHHPIIFNSCLPREELGWSLYPSIFVFEINYFCLYGTPSFSTLLSRSLFLIELVETRGRFHRSYFKVGEILFKKKVKSVRSGDPELGGHSNYLLVYCRYKQNNRRQWWLQT